MKEKGVEGAQLSRKGHKIDAKTHAAHSKLGKIEQILTKSIQKYHISKRNWTW